MQDSVAIKTVSPAGGTSSTEDTNGFFSHLWETVESRGQRHHGWMMDKNESFCMVAEYSAKQREDIV